MGRFFLGFGCAQGKDPLRGHILTGGDLKGREDLTSQTVVRIAGEADLFTAEFDPFQLFQPDSGF